MKKQSSFRLSEETLRTINKLHVKLDIPKAQIIERAIMLYDIAAKQAKFKSTNFAGLMKPETLIELLRDKKQY
jgi:predicted transcriptional regulator